MGIRGSVVEAGPAAGRRHTRVRQDALAIAVEAVMPIFRATGLMKSLCTIKEPDDSDTGAPAGTYSDVADLVEIPCMDAPENTGGGLSANEAKRVTETVSDGS